jgi:hypothetical protein
MKLFVILILFFSCENIIPQEKELYFIETTPILIKDSLLFAFADDDDSLYFILTKRNYDEIDTSKHIYAELMEGEKYKLSLNKYVNRIKIDYFIRGGRYKYNYLDYVNNDTLIGNVYNSPNIYGFYFKGK